ncbi:MAG: hypothetical protein VX075_15685, partial [Pseudomonadota bacterium]|nr:hypothetical protein [Pseudomonadota bacterium]
SFGIALVAGKNRVPRPPTGKIALRTGEDMNEPIEYFRSSLSLFATACCSAQPRRCYVGSVF